MRSKEILLNPGPVNVDERVRQALNGPDMCHREPEFAALMQRVSRKVTEVCGGDETYASVIFSGSGTAALEAALSSIVPPDGKILILDNGHYGERLEKIVALHRIAHEVKRYGWSVPFDLVEIENILREDSALTHIGMVHHETSTGMLNPLREMGALAARYGQSLMVDAVSSVGGEILDMRADHIDWCVGTSNKCIEGMPGLSFVCAPRVRLDALKAIPARSFYLDLYQQYFATDKLHAPPFTPAVQTFCAFEVALDLALAEGVEARHRRYQSLAARVRKGLADLNFQFLLPPEQRAATLAALYLPDGVSYHELHDALKSKGFVIYAAQESLKQKVFRIANMGQITTDDMDRFLAALGEVLADPRPRGKAGA